MKLKKRLKDYLDYLLCNIFVPGDYSTLVMELRLTDNARDFISFGPYFNSSRVTIKFLLSDLYTTFFGCQDISRMKVIHKICDVIDATFHVRPKLRVDFAKALLQNEDCSLTKIESIINTSTISTDTIGNAVPNSIQLVHGESLKLS